MIYVVIPVRVDQTGDAPVFTAIVDGTPRSGFAFGDSVVRAVRGLFDAEGPIVRKAVNE